MTELAIEAEGVSKVFGDKVAVNNLSFTVGRGELFGLLGPNGAGKTTMIRMALDLIQATRGRVTLLGHPMSPALAGRIGYLPEERGLYRDVSVLDGLVYFASLKGVPRAEARRRALRYLEKVGIADTASKPVRALSRGMQQKVQILATILHRPELLIIDEPFSGLDPVNTRVLRDLLLEMRQFGTTIVMSTHQMNRVQELCDRLLMLNNGKMVLYGSVDEIRSLFGGDSVLVDADGDLAAVPGVRAVRQRNGLTELILAKRFDPDAFLRQLIAQGDVRIRHFEVREPSLEEIFIAVAGGAP